MEQTGTVFTELDFEKITSIKIALRLQANASVEEGLTIIQKLANHIRGAVEPDLIKKIETKMQYSRILEISTDLEQTKVNLVAFLRCDLLRDFEEDIIQSYADEKQLRL